MSVSTSQFPLVSVVIPALNARRTIQRALDSVGLQNWQPLEVIVVDDASTDGTPEAVEALANSQVRLVRMTRNGGASAARNRGVQAARGKYVAFLDADDAWCGGKLQAQVAVLEANPHMSFVTCNSVVLNDAGDVVRRSHQRYTPVEGPDAWKTLLAYNFVPTPTVVARRDDLLRAGEFNVALPIGEDLDMWIRLALVGEVGVLPQVFVNIHEVAASLSKRNVHQERSSLLPVLHRYIRDLQPRLTAAEIRAIYGRRFFSWGAYSFDNALYWESLGLFARAAWNRYRFIRSSVNVPRSLIMALLQVVFGRERLSGLPGRNGDKWSGRHAPQAD